MRRLKALQAQLFLEHVVSAVLSDAFEDLGWHVCSGLPAASGGERWSFCLGQFLFLLFKFFQFLIGFLVNSPDSVSVGVQDGLG